MPRSTSRYVTWVTPEFWERLGKHLKLYYPKFYWNTRTELLDAKARSRAIMEEKGTTGVDETKDT